MPFLTVEVAVEAALALDAPALIIIDDAWRLHLTGLLLALLPLHVAEEGSFPRRVVEGRGATPVCFTAARLFGGHGQVLQAQLLVIARGDFLVGVQDRRTANPHQVTR